MKSATASSWGLYDMFGSVWEWCFDRFLVAGGYPADAQPRTNPVGTSDAATATTPGVYRGGSFNEANNLLSIGGSRWSGGLEYRAANVGFRVAIQLR